MIRVVAVAPSSRRLAAAEVCKDTFASPLRPIIRKPDRSPDRRWQSNVKDRFPSV
jgi:hypothetical protein